MILKETKDKQKVLDILNTWLRAYEARDLEAFRVIMSSSEDHVSWGTGEDERYVGVTGFLAQVRRDFEQSEGAKMKVMNTYTTIHEQTAWIAAEIEPTISIEGMEHTLPILRATMFLAKDGEEWKIEHTHASWPFPKQDAGKSFPR